MRFPYRDLFYNATTGEYEEMTKPLDRESEVKKFLEEGIKNINNNVLAIVREDYIHKADYETRLKADMVAMLTEIQLEIEELDTSNNNCAYLDCADIIQQKIDKLKEVEQ